MKILLGTIAVIVGTFLYEWWRSINNKRRPYHIPRILKYNEGLVLLGYLLWSTIIIYGLITLYKINFVLPILFFIFSFISKKISNNRLSLDRQIAIIFKMYVEEKKDIKNNSKNDTEILLITAKKYLPTRNWGSRYYIFEESPPKNIKGLVTDLIWYVHDTWVDPENDIEVSKFREIAKERIDILYEQYFNKNVN